MYGPHAIRRLVIYFIKKTKQKQNKTENRKKRKGKKAHHYLLATQAQLSTAEISSGKNCKLKVVCSCFIGNCWHTHFGQLVQFVKSFASEQVKDCWFYK